MSAQVISLVTYSATISTEHFVLRFVTLAFLCLAYSSPLQTRNSTDISTIPTFIDNLNSAAYADSLYYGSGNITSDVPAGDATLTELPAGNVTSTDLPAENIAYPAWSGGNLTFSALRNVSVIVDIDFRVPRLSFNGQRLLGGHMALWLAGTSADGPLQIEFVRSNELAIRIYDWNVSNANQTIAPNGPAGCDRRILQLGQTTATNADMAHSQTGNGIVADVHQTYPGYQSGTRTGIHFVRDLSSQLGIKQGPIFDELFSLIEDYEQLPPLLSQPTLPLVFETIRSWGDRSKNSWTRFELASNQTLPASTNPTHTTLGSTDYFPDTSEPLSDLSQLRQPLMDPWEGRISTAQPSFSPRANNALQGRSILSPPQTSRRASANRSLVSLDRRAPPQRAVTIIIDRYAGLSQNAIHTSVHIAGVAGSDAPLRLELVKDSVHFATRDTQMVVRVREELPMQLRVRGLTQYVDAGTTAMDNPSISKAAELVLGRRSFNKIEPWMWIPGSNDCNTFVQRLLTQMGQQIPSKFEFIKRESDAWYKKNSIIHGKVEFLMKDRIGWDNGKPYWKREQWDLSDTKTKVATLAGGEAYVLKNVPENVVAEFTSQGGRPPAEGRPGSSSPPADRVGTSVDGGSKEATANKFSGLSLCQRDQSLRHRSCETTAVEEPKSVALARFEGKALAVRLGQTAGGFGAAVGIAAGVALVVVDFIHGNYVGAAIGLVETALSIAAMALLDVPMGFLVSGFLAFVSGLLSLARQQNADLKLPDVNDAQQIVQYCMFGDAKHTGNEQCRAGTPDHPGNPNCTVLYGPGIIASIFGWSNFDAVAFMLEYNKGYSMSIPQIAAAFQVIAPSTLEQMGPAMAQAASSLEHRNDDGIATIHYDTNYLYYPQQFSFNPTFQLNRNRITIPVIGQTADVVFNRLIPNPGGDCKIIEDLGTYQYAQYNLTVSGAPVAIACNVTSTGMRDGTSNLVANMTAQGVLSTTRTGPGAGAASLKKTGASESPMAANSSTDGQDHRTVPPPQPPLGLPTTLNSSNAVCMSGPGGGQCFPSGTFQTQQGSLGFNSSQAINLSMPSGSWVSYRAIGHNNGVDRPQTITPMNITSATDNATFHASIYQQAADATDHTFDVHVAGRDMPVLCLFTLPAFMGDVACYGPGSGNVPENMINRAQSVVPHGGVQFWMYAESYGDPGAVQYSSSIPDLSAVAYGSGTFNQHLKALWIIDSLNS